MPINTGAIVKVLELISIEKGLRCTVSEGLKGAVTIGAFAFGGALLGGPVGMGIAGTLGSIVTAATSRGKFKSVATVISEEMTPMQLRELENHFQAIFADLDATDVTQLAMLIMSTPNMQALVLKQLGIFFKEQMALQIV